MSESVLEVIVTSSKAKEEGPLDHFICTRENPDRAHRFDWPVKAICGTILTEPPKFVGKPTKCVVCEEMAPAHIEHLRPW